MALIFDLQGLARFAVDDDRDHISRYLASQLDPYEPTVGLVPEETDVVLTPNDGILQRKLCDVHGPAGDGRHTGSDGRRCYLLYGKSRFELPRFDAAAGRLRLSYDTHFPLWVAFAEVVRPLVQLATISHRAITVHGAAVQVGEGGLVVCGWSESGKTETALALAEAGARFLSDKWTIIDSAARVHAFPVAVGIRDWVLEYLPRLRTHVRYSDRARLRVARTARAALPLAARATAGPRGAAAESQLDRALTLASRLSLPQSEVAAVYGSARDPFAAPALTTLALLTTVPGDRVSVRPVEAGWAAHRLALSAAYERRALYELDARTRYAIGANAPSPLLQVPAQEAELLRGVLEGVQLLEVRAPFPSDPRKIADALAPCC